MDKFTIQDLNLYYGDFHALKGISLDIPQKQEIIEDWESKFAPAVPPEIVEALAQNPQLLQLVTQAVTAQQTVQQMQTAQQVPTGQMGGNPTADQFDMMGGGASAVPTV